MERKKLSDQEYHEARAEITSQGVRGLLLINGGAAVALLAFLQALWRADVPDYELMRTIIVALGVLCGGVCCGATVNFIRYHTSIAYQNDYRIRKIVFERLSFATQYLSLLAFLGAMAVLLVGVWRIISAACDS